MSSKTKRALLIGNTEYEVGKLQRCKNDAEDVSKELEQMGFKVVIGFDLTFYKMTDMIDNFVEEIEKNDFVVFFFSGHGTEWDNQNYLIPIDNQCLHERLERHKHRAVSAQNIIEWMKKKQPFSIVFLLDCCRTRAQETKSSFTGSNFNNAMPIKGVAGSYIVFACGPDQQTFDKSPDYHHGLFTHHLLKHIAKPNLKIDEMMCLVCDGIYNDSDGQIYTHRSSSLRTPEIYFNTKAKDFTCIDQSLNEKRSSQTTKFHNSSETESSSREKLDHTINDDDMIKLAINEMIHSLELDDSERKHEIINDLLENGQQSLTKYKADFKPKIYSAAMKGNDNELLKSLKKYFEKQWKVQYGSSNKWFSSLLRQYQNDANYQCVLNRTSKYGNKYMKTCPILSIVLQLLFDGFNDQWFNESNEFNDLWFTITNNGLKSINKYSDYITRSRLNAIINKEQPALFQALREFYRPELFKLLNETNVTNRDNLYELILDNVAEYGWLTGLEKSRDHIIPKHFNILFEKISSQKQRQSTTSYPIPEQISWFDNVTPDEKEKKQWYVKDLRQDLANMPSCAERSVIELLVHFEDKSAEDYIFLRKDDTLIPLLQKLQVQIKKEELFSEKIQENFQKLKFYVHCQDIALIVCSLRELVKEIRPLNVQEIQRLVEKAKKAGQLICGKDIILLIGETGTGKSTTIQFLAGCKMKEIRVKVELEGFLEHIIADGPITNPELKNVTTSPRSKAETRYIIPVTIPLRDIFGPYEFGEIILCDAPGFGNTAGPEVDIANSVGVIEAIKRCKSVKILALSSYTSLGDRGQGIQKLMHLLINMVHGIQERLSAIFYAFTKYPSNVDISARLADIKISKVETDPLLQSDSAFVTVLTDMINKTRSGVEKIDPIRGDPKSIIEKLKNVRGIQYPEEVFRFSVSEETRACIANQAQRDNSNIRCALKHKDIGLVMYYINDLKTLTDLLQCSMVDDAYKNAVRFIRENIMDYCTGVKKKFSHSLASQDELEKEDIDEYKNSIEYIQQIQRLAEHLGSDIISPEVLMRNIYLELQEFREALEKESLDSPLVEIYFNNLCIIKDSFNEFESFYSDSCKHFEERFRKLVQSAHEPISENDFSKVAEIIRRVSKCLPILNNHFHGLVEEKYEEIVQSLLQHLNRVSEKADPILAKIRLIGIDVEIVRECVNILRSAKENSALEDRITTYVEMLTKKNDKLAENVKSLGNIYNALIEKIINYFNQITSRISELFQTSGDRALEDVETLVNGMDAIRTIPEIESKTAGAYYRTIENIHERTHQLQRDVEQILYSIYSQTGIPDYGKIARLLSRLKNAKWMNCVIPGAYDFSMNRVTEELIQYVHQLAERLMKLDFSLKRPENVCIAEEIFQKIESLGVLERSLPELKQSKDAMIQRLIESVEGNFKRIQTTFNLQDNSVYKMKQELKEFEQIKREYDNLHPARVFLRNYDFSDINKLNDEINDLENKQQIELKQEQEKKSKIESELNALKSITQQHDHLRQSNVNQDKSERKQETNKHLKLVKDSNIDTIHETLVKTEERRNDQVKIIQKIQNKYKNYLTPLKSIKEQYESLLKTSDSRSLEQTNLLQEKGYDSIESLIKIIEKKKNLIAECQKKKQSYGFSYGFDAHTADIALLYTANCGNIANISLREMAADTHEILKKYINEYGLFLNKEIDKLFKHLTTVDDQVNLYHYPQDLEIRLEELSSLSEFKHVFECIEGTRKVKFWREAFKRQHRDMSTSMEKYKTSGKNEELRTQLIIAQGLIGSDNFCGDTFLSNGFAALYKHYRVETVNESKEAYKTVLKCISEGDYAKVDMELTDVNEKTTNRKEIDNIKHNLQTSLKNLMQSTQKIVIDLDQRIKLMENNSSQTEKINKNIEKIHIILSKPRLKEFIDQKTQSDLNNFEESIKKRLSEMLLEKLKSIEEFINNDDSFEAEQSMEDFSRIHHELANHFTMENVTEKANEVKKTLNNLANEILKQNDFKNTEKYSEKPPKNLLCKLEKAVSYRSQKYAKVLSSISSDIHDYFETAIKKACEAPIEKRYTQILPLNSALKFLPANLQKSFKSQIDDLIKKFLEEEKEYKRNLKDFLENETINDSTIKRIGELVLQYKQEKRDEPLDILRSEVITKLDNHWKSVQNALDSNNIQSAIDNMKQIIRYKDNVQNMSEIDGFYKQMCTLVSTEVINCAKTLTNMFEIEKTQIVEKAFSNMIAYVELGEEFPSSMNELLPEQVMRNIEIGLKNLYDNWQNNSETFDTAINELNIKSIRKVTSIMEHWNGVLNMITNCSCQHNLICQFSNAIKKNIKSYSEMIDELKKKIADLKQNLDVQLISDERTRFEAVRDQFFSNLGLYLEVLKSIRSEFENVFLSETDIKKLETGLKDKVEDIKEKLLNVASNDQLSQLESDYFRKYYNHLVSFDKYVNLPKAKIRDTLELAETKIFEKVKSLSKAITSSGPDCIKIAESLVQMKFFAENFSMFDMKINGIIDEVLKSCKAQYGALALSQMTMALEKTDEGARLIAEHSCLSGEDWRKRREKMQKQDDLDYVVNELTGDDLAKDVLSSRYKSFRKTYDDLISNILASFNPKTQAEPDLEVLITQTKVLIGEILQKANEVTWDHSFRDQIPQLLAHIFAVWTLKNTHHYNTTRGIDKSNAYLLMPHVGQVIAIFRILGIGYKMDMKVGHMYVPFVKRISNDLINNLVQIGTGEGKSVVMAITACLFALVGVDVNCSCYSEYLSMRDKNDFAPVFQALGIEERIHYGTFNKLCENFLNEQCNIREKVYDMIINNKNAIDVVQTKARVRSKVLLIDEVDVFLSEKYYGGMYTPAIYLKHSSIKNLLDILWQNRNLHTLNAVKLTSAYQACAIRFSNWVFLFDEAIKDMLAALKSYQSSTYIVQNDKIVYVEGESIAENVVHGYDTIWAYYYENQKGFISQNSLETNVGIIINCETFSYAEIPHEFAYIMGVTGTLKTLATSEKNILQKVYGIHKNTYMPSIFGASYRNYYPVNDVEAVKKSEYFMRIRGEIDMMCRAQRAILVFFESEEKLMTFYNSSELSSIKESIQIITETVSIKERELCIIRATTNGRVTLLTPTFGRGTDFICRNQQVLANGGVHVLQTFFSKELSEEYQIMGRGARQGDRGSYRMILLDTDLEWVLDAHVEKILKIRGSTIYQALNEARNALYESKCASKGLSVEQSRHEHQASRNFMNALYEGQMHIVKRFLTEQNRGANIASGISRTLLLMNATGSMSSLLYATKDIVYAVFERASTILEEKGIPKDAFQIQFAVYRNYSSKDNKILEVSSWERKASNLRTFLNAIDPNGGMGAKAIEIAFSHAAKESETQDGISQVILIGDAPANTRSDVTNKRAQLGEAYWKTTRFATPTYYEDELQKLKEKNIPIHTLYLTIYAKDNFQKIANETKGRCAPLNICSPVSAELLTNFVTEEVIRKAAENHESSTVELYRKKYIKKMFTS